MKRTVRRFFIALAALVFVFALVLSGCTSQSAYVTSIAKTGTNGTEDIYTITYSDGSTDTFTVTNGTDGKDAEEIGISDIYEAYKEQTENSDVTFEEAKAALEAQDFVLEADRVEFKRGNWAYVTPSTNFVSLIDGKATVQLAFNGAFSGPNGIGGITVEGNPSNISLKTDKKGNTMFQMMVQGVGISASVSIRMIDGSAKCTATVSPNFSGNRISFTGTLYPSSASSVYKGRAL